MTLAEAIATIDGQIDEYDIAIRDAWRVARGGLRRAPRRSSTQFAAVAVDETGEPITAKQRFAHATEDLVKVSEEISKVSDEIKDRKGRGDGG